jgi:hypothetical protein
VLHEEEFPRHRRKEATRSANASRARRDAATIDLERTSADCVQTDEPLFVVAERPHAPVGKRRGARALARRGTIYRVAVEGQTPPLSSTSGSAQRPRELVLAIDSGDSPPLPGEGGALRRPMHWCFSRVRRRISFVQRQPRAPPRCL